MTNDETPMTAALRMNAEINTSADWQRRWQIEREDNERLNAVLSRVRTGVHGLIANAQRMQRDQEAKLVAATEPHVHRAGLVGAASAHGRFTALHDVLELMEAAEGGNAEG
jgi:hypothetical protein